jgi:hypothetical protein
MLTVDCRSVWSWFTCNDSIRLNQGASCLGRSVATHELLPSYLRISSPVVRRKMALLRPPSTCSGSGGSHSITLAQLRCNSSRFGICSRENVMLGEKNEAFWLRTRKASTAYASTGATPMQEFAFWHIFERKSDVGRKKCEHVAVSLLVDQQHTGTRCLR